ncbi:MAG TPA: class I SAM-dependent methyltransferase [Phycisphaerae bacterium]|nr:class I SAM-dependent methyltransferase [Phycisphaerae bacterium]
MHDPVGSTSWHNRHLAHFKRLDELLRAEGPGRPTIMLIGPGGVTRLAGMLLNDAAANGSSAIRKLIGDAARYSDQVLRRIPWMPLASLEPVELESVITVPHELVVVDHSRRILSAVRTQLPQAKCLLTDISFQRPSVEADVVIAFNVVCRLEDPGAGMANIVAAVRPGGLLMMDDRSAEAHLWPLHRFTSIAPKIYRRDA